MDRRRRDERLIPRVAATVLALLAGTLGATACGSRAAPGTAELWLGGDVHLGERTERLFERTPPELRGAAGIVNLEGAVSARPEPSSARRLVSAEGTLGALRAAGVRVATLANNHARDLGDDAPSRSSRALAARGVEAAGGPAGVAVLELAGRRVAIAAFDLSRGSPRALDARLARARRMGDDLVVAFHVLAPSLYLPGPELRRAVGRAVAHGARVVVAHGTHTIAPVERRAGAVIAWGLGNLVFRCSCSREDDGMLLRVSLGSGRVRAGVVPLRAGLGGRGARPSPEPAHDLALLDALGSAPLRRVGGAGWL